MTLVRRSDRDRETARVSERVKAALSREPSVLAIFRNGSTVVGTDQPGSDVDFTVLVRQSRDRSRALRVLRRHFRYLGPDHEVPSFAGRRKIGITILDRASATRLLRRLYRSPEDFLGSQDVVQHKIVEAVAIYDPAGFLSRFQAMAEAYPERIRRAVFRRAIRSLETAYQEWGWRNEFHYACELPGILEAVCLALYARNRRLFMRPFKRLPKDLKELKPNLEAEVYRLARSGRSEHSRRAARRVLQRILRQLGRGM